MQETASSLPVHGARFGNARAAPARSMPEPGFDQADGPVMGRQPLLRGRSDDANTNESGGPRPDVREVSRPAPGCPDSLRAGVPVRRLLLAAVPADPGGGPDAAGGGAG